MSWWGIVLVSILATLVLGVLWFLMDEFGYDFLPWGLCDAFTEMIMPGLIVISIIGFVVGLVFGMCETLVESEKPENQISYYMEQREEIIEKLNENPFDNLVIKDAIDWNGNIEKMKVDDTDGYFTDVESIDYKNYQRKYAKNELNMVPADGSEIVDETVIEIDKNEFEELKNYISELEEELNNKKNDTGKKDSVDKILNKYGK